MKLSCIYAMFKNIWWTKYCMNTIQKLRQWSTTILLCSIVVGLKHDCFKLLVFFYSIKYFCYNVLSLVIKYLLFCKTTYFFFSFNCSSMNTHWHTHKKKCWAISFSPLFKFFLKASTFIKQTVKKNLEFCIQNKLGI